MSSQLLRSRESFVLQNSDGYFKCVCVSWWRMNFVEHFAELTFCSFLVGVVLFEYDIADNIEKKEKIDNQLKWDVTVKCVICVRANKLFLLLNDSGQEKPNQ